MTTIKKTAKYSLNKGSLQSDGLYNVSENEGEGLSFWFDNDTAKELRKLKTKEFNRRCEELIEESEVDEPKERKGTQRSPFGIWS